MALRKTDVPDGKSAKAIDFPMGLCYNINKRSAYGFGSGAPWGAWETEPLVCRPAAAAAETERNSI